MKETLYYVVRIAAFIVIAIAAHTALHAKGCAEEIVTVYSWGNYELRCSGRYMMYQPLEALEKRRFHGFTQR